MINSRSTIPEKDLIISIFVSQSKINPLTANVMMYNIFNNFELIMKSLNTFDLKRKLLSALKNIDEDKIIKADSNKYKEFSTILTQYYLNNTTSDFEYCENKIIGALTLLVLNNFTEKCSEIDQNEMRNLFVNKTL